MDARRERVANLIRDAFSGVTLGNGVGLWQGQALDDYEDERTQAEYRARDEKTDWSAIPVDDLNRCRSTLCFFDAEGMRFRLPAFLLAKLEGTLWNDVLFILVNVDHYTKTQLFALSDAQRRAVREFLLLSRDECFDAGDRREIDQAIAEFWTEAETR